MSESRVVPAAPELLPPSTQLKTGSVQETQNGADPENQPRSSPDDPHSGSSHAPKAAPEPEPEEEEQAASTDLPLVFNGLDPDTGEYLLEYQTLEELHKLVRWHCRISDQFEARGEPADGVNPNDLSQAGWGLVLAQGAGTAVREALQPLIDHRRAQIRQGLERSRVASIGAMTRQLCQVLPDEEGLLGESLGSWLAPFNATLHDPADPAEKLPYFLLLVAGPEEVPFSVQRRLATSYAVGRIAFLNAAGQHDVDAYRRYAESVVAAESGAAKRREAVFFGAQNPDDKATLYPIDWLLRPAAQALVRRGEGWRVGCYLGQGQATKDRLRTLLGGKETPALLFTSSHGLGYSEKSPEALGGLVCQDWPGPEQGAGRLARDHFFAAQDVDPKADLRGLILFSFACFSAGQPEQDMYSLSLDQDEPCLRTGVARLSPLPQQLLTNPGGGALAMIGHADRARGFSYVWPGAGLQTHTIRSVLSSLLRGQPVGHAARRYLSARALALQAELQDALDKVHTEKLDPRAVTHLWLALQDARGYTVLGDPAARLQVES